MKIKNNYSQILAYIGLFIMYYSGICDALIVNGNGIELHSITGFSIVAFVFIIYIYGITTNKKLIYILSYIIALLGYLYSIYIILMMSVLSEYLVETSNVAIYSSRLGIGSYLYIISLIIFIISIFLPKGQEKNNTNLSPLDNKMIDINKNNYIFCKYIYGCKELNSNADGVIKINENNTLSIIVLDNENKPQEKIINYNDIKDIIIKNSIIFTENTPQVKDNTVANNILAITMFGGGLSSYALSSFMNQAESYNKMTEKVIYEINVILETGTILIQTKNNPQEFISTIKYNQKI